MRMKPLYCTLSEIVLSLYYALHIAPYLSHCTATVLHHVPHLSHCTSLESFYCHCTAHCTSPESLYARDVTAALSGTEKDETRLKERRFHNSSWPSEAQPPGP